jgi:maltose O-acetyltransferase
MSSERERVLAGELCDPADAELTALRRQGARTARRFNASSKPELLRELFGRIGEDAVIEPPFHCDYGENIAVGARFYAYAGCVFLDCAAITFGDRVLLGPGVHVYAATHPLDAETRRRGLELAAPVTIGDDVWIGGAAIVLPGVSIGDCAVIGAGSVVTHDVPADVVAAGNPCRPVRELEAV